MDTTDGEKRDDEKREGDKRRERGEKTRPPTGARQDHRSKGTSLNAAPFGGREKACMRL